MEKYYQLLLGLSTVFVGLLGVSSCVRAVTRYVQSATPTIFVHGWESSSHTEEKMASAAHDAGITSTIARASTDKKGKVTLKRPIPADAVNPIMEVNLEDNKLSAYRDDYTQGYHRDGEYIKSVVLTLEKQHHYRQTDLVGHSMGNLEIINYISDNINDKSFPQIAHLVAVTGHYNGLAGQSETQNAKINLKTGELERMDSACHELLGLRQTFPKNTAMLNIYGDVGDGGHSDEDVPVNSAKSLKYLVSDRANRIAKLKFMEKMPSAVSFTMTAK